MYVARRITPAAAADTPQVLYGADDPHTIHHVLEVVDDEIPQTSPFPAALCTMQKWLKPERAARLILEHVVNICCVRLKHFVWPASYDILHTYKVATFICQRIWLASKHLLSEAATDQRCLQGVDVTVHVTVPLIACCRQPQQTEIYHTATVCIPCSKY